MTFRKNIIIQKTIIHILSLLPFIWLMWQGWLLYDFQDHGLTANPIQYINQYTGDWAVRYILIGLAITPLRKMLGLNSLVQFRRMIGLYATFYVTLHFFNFIILDHFFDWALIWTDIIKRPAITFGMTAIILMVPLAVTSTKGWIKRLGKKWVKLHKIVYPMGVLAVIHNYMMVKADVVEPLIHIGILAILLGIRLYWANTTKKGSRNTAFS